MAEKRCTKCLCVKPLTEFAKSMEPMEVINIDHDHTCCPGRRSCGKCIRGLPCPVCNRGLGMFKDSVKSLLRAVDYLEGGDSDR